VFFEVEQIMSKGALSQYKSVDLAASVQTASPHQLVSMLLQGAQGALAVAKGALERKDFETRSRQINKASSIFLELRSCLDLESGGELAANLDRLYEYMIRQLLVANKDNSIEIIEEVQDLLKGVTEAWSSIPPEHHRQID